MRKVISIFLIAILTICGAFTPSGEGWYTGAAEAHGAELSANEQMVREIYQRTRNEYRTKTSVSSHWEAAVARSVLGDDIANYGIKLSGIDGSSASPAGIVLALVALDENPYNYATETYSEGHNYVADLLALSKNELIAAGSKSFAASYNALALQVAGAKVGSALYDELMTAGPVASCMDLGYGPDIGGVGVNALALEIDKDPYIAALKNYVAAVDGATAASVSMGGTPEITYSCVVVGLNALLEANASAADFEGVAGFNAATDSPWTTQGLIPKMYDYIRPYFSGKTVAFSYQTLMAFSDLYSVANGGKTGWHAGKVDAEKLAALETKAQAIIDAYEEASPEAGGGGVSQPADTALEENPSEDGEESEQGDREAVEGLTDSVTSEQITALKAALETTKNGIPQEARAKSVATYGAEYFALRDAVRAIESGTGEADRTGGDVDEYKGGSSDSGNSGSGSSGNSGSGGSGSGSTGGGGASSGGGAVVTTKDIKVYFAIQGDEKHGEGSATTHTLKKKNLETWYRSTAFTLESGATADDLFQEGIKAAGLKYKGNASNSYGALYVSAIQIPGTSDYLGEFDNGPKSGWMYTINGKHPEKGLSLYTLSDGDRMVIHYTDDFTAEQGSDEYNNMGAGSAGGGVAATGSAADESTAAETEGEAVDGTSESEAAENSNEVSLELLQSTGLSEEEAKAAVEKSEEAWKSFEDVKEDAWYERPVKTMLALGLMQGKGEGSFDPSGKATREQIMTVLARAAGQASPERVGDPTGRPERSEAEGLNSGMGGGSELTEGSSQWAKWAVSWAIENGISDGSDPKGNISREQFITMLYRVASSENGIDSRAAAGKPPLKGEGDREAVEGFKDASQIHSWSSEAMKWAISEGIIAGYEDSTLRPQAEVSRAEIATMIERYLGTKK